MEIGKRVEKFIQEHTRNTYNYNSYAQDPMPWLSIDEARKAVEIAKGDNELTWEDIRKLYIIFAEVDTEIELCKTDIKSETIGYYQEVLKRFKDFKERKEK